MTSILERFPASRQCLAHRTHLTGIGPRTLAQAMAAGTVIRLRRGTYGLSPLPARRRHLLTDGVPDTGYVAAVRSAVLSLAAPAAHRTAALLYGMDMLVEPSKVELRVPHNRGTTADKDVVLFFSRATSVLDHPVLGLDPIPLTTPVDTVLDCVTSRPMREAVVIADSALRRKLVTVEELVAGADARRAHPHSTRFRRLLHLIDPDSGSVLESVLRYLLLTHALVPQSQHTIRRGTLFIGRFDFCFLLERVIIECDGRRWHDPADVRDKDRDKGNAVTRLGWRLLRFTWREVVDSPAYVLACIQETFELALAA